MLIEHIQEYLNTLPADRDPKKMSLSKMGQCIRRTYYDSLGTPQKPLDWQSQMIFDDGKVGHDQIRRMLREAAKGAYILHNEEAKVTYKYKTISISGHIDGIICYGGDHSRDALLEFKTMGEYPFDRFIKGENLDRTYRIQMQAYMAAAGLKRCFYLVKNKNTAALAEREYLFDPVELEAHSQRLIDAQDRIPEREYGFSGKKLDWHCGYCPYVETCWEGEVTETKRNTYVKAEKV